MDFTCRDCQHYTPVCKKFGKCRITDDEIEGNQQRCKEFIPNDDNSMNILSQLTGKDT